MNTEIEPFFNRKYSFDNGYVIFKESNYIDSPWGTGKLEKWDLSKSSNGVPNTNYVKYDFFLKLNSWPKIYEIKFTTNKTFISKENGTGNLMDIINYELLKNKYSWTITKQDKECKEGDVSFYADGNLKIVNINNNESCGSYLWLKDIKDTKVYNVKLNNTKFKIILNGNKQSFVITDNVDKKLGSGAHICSF